MSDKHLVIFEPNAGGHHGLFVQHLIRYWGSEKLSGVLEVLVTERFLEIHEHISTLIASYKDSDIRITRIDQLPPIKGGGMRALLQHDFRQGKLLKQQLNRIRPSHALLMYFDHLQISLGTTLRTIPDTHIAGIYFRPSFHYPILKKESAPRPVMTRQIRKRLQLKLALSNPRVQTLFSLDPYVVPHLNTMTRHAKAVVLPDGIERVESTASDVVDWNVEDTRLTAFCFGSLARRKGVFNLLDSLHYLPDSVQKKLALVFTGVVAQSEKNDFYTKLDQARNETDVQIVVDDRFVDDAEVQPMIRQADLILIAYQHHIGSSNVLIRAADAGLPVLGSNYGVIGAQIHDHALGLAVDTTNPREIALGLESFINQGAPQHFDKKTAQRFAASHDATLYAKTIFSTLGFV